MTTHNSGRSRDENRRKVKVVDRTVCHLCKSPGLKPDELYCPNCGFPQGGTEQQQRKFLVERRQKRSEIRDSEKLIRRGRNSLFIIAMVNMLNFLVDDKVILLIGIILSSLFFAIGLWASKKPFPAFLTGLILYVSLHLFLGILDFNFLLRGLLLKIAISGALIYGLYAIKKIEKLNNDLKL